LTADCCPRRVCGAAWGVVLVAEEPLPPQTTQIHQLLAKLVALASFVGSSLDEAAVDAA